MAEQRTLDAERAELYPKAVAIVKEQKRASVSLVQRRLRLSWDTARDLVELMLERKDVPVEWAPVVYQLAARRAPPALDAEELTPIEYDQAMQRTYIPLPGGWEIQTKGTGSSFRIAHAQSRQRWIVMDDRLHEPLEAMARDVRNAYNAARTSAPEGAPVGMVLVPVEPTDEMVVAFAETWFSKVRPIDDCGMEDCYAAMIAAAPTSASAQPSSPEIPDNSNSSNFSSSSASAQPARQDQQAAEQSVIACARRVLSKFGADSDWSEWKDLADALREFDSAGQDQQSAQCASVDTEDAFAWAVFADNGNVIIWSKRRDVVEPVAAEYGKPIVPVIAHINAWGSAGSGAIPVHQVYYGTEGWRDIEASQIDEHRGMGFEVRTLYATPSPAPQGEQA